MPSDGAFLRIGVTGGIGAGKSAVCAAFTRRGRAVISADEVARMVMTTDAAVRKRVTAICGPGAYGADGTLNARYIADVIFEDAKKRAAVNGAVHPVVIQRIADAIEALPDERRRPYVLIEAALLYESGMDADLDAVLVVHAGEEVRIGRIMERGGVPRTDAERRMRAQISAEKKRGRADFVIVNEGSLASLEERVAFFDLLFTRMVG